MSTPYQERELPELSVDASNEPWLAAAAQGRLLLRVCTACRKPHWYPRALCPFCLQDTEWQDAKGTGRIYSLSVTRRAGPVAYAVAYVTLDEGVTMLTNIVDTDLDTLAIGQPVRVVFKAAPGGRMVAMFAPA